MKKQENQLWSVLLDGGLVQGSAQEVEPRTEKLESPWYVKVILAFSGWLAALFLLGFVGLGFSFVIENNIASFVVGSAMITAAFFALRLSKNEFFEHMTLALSLAGQALIVFGIFNANGINHSLAWTLVALLQLPLIVLMPHFVHRVFSSYIAVHAFSIAFNIMGIPYVFSATILLAASWLWLNEFRFPQNMQAIRAIGYGLVLALIQLKGGHNIIDLRPNNSPSELWIQPWMGEIFMAAVMLYVVWKLLRRHNHFPPKRPAIMVLLGTLLLCVLSLEANGIIVGVVIILLGFTGGNRVLFGLGVVSLLFYASSYYYLLDATLLEKSQTLLAIGLFLLAARWLMTRVLPNAKEVNHG